MDLLKLFIKSAFVDNMIFAFFFGMCSYLAVSKTVKTAFGLGMAVIFVLTVTIPVNYLLENYVLKEGALTWLGQEYAGYDLSFLSFIMFIAVIASIVQLVEMIVEKLKSGQQMNISDLNLDNQLVNKINKFAPIKHILRNKSHDEHKVMELLEDISRDLMNYDLDFRIQELESKFSRDMSESTFNELKELKKKQNLN